MNGMDGIIPLGLLMSINAMLNGIGSGFEVKGIVTTAASLPASGDLGDVYLVSSEGYARYTWDNTENKWAAMVNDVATAEDLQAALYS